MSLDFRLNIIEIDFSLNDIDWNNLQSDQNGTCWIGSMGSCWNQADVSVALSNAFEIRLDSFQTSVLASGATVRLEGDIIKLGDFLEPVS